MARRGLFCWMLRNTGHFARLPNLAKKRVYSDSLREAEGVVGRGRPAWCNTTCSLHPCKIWPWRQSSAPGRLCQNASCPKPECQLAAFAPRIRQVARILLKFRCMETTKIIITSSPEANNHLLCSRARRSAAATRFSAPASVLRKKRIEEKELAFLRPQILNAHELQ